MPRITASVSILVSVLLAIGLFSGCSRGPMKPTKANVDKFMTIMQAAGASMTAKEVQDGQTSDKGKRRNAGKLLVEPFEQAGFDLDATLTDYAIRLRDGNLTQEEGEVVMVVIGMYKDVVPDLARWGFIKAETRDLVVAAANR
jgi:hypothetical protein